MRANLGMKIERKYYGGGRIMHWFISGTPSMHDNESLSSY